MKRIAYLGIKGLPSQAGADRVVEAIVQGVDKQQYQPVVYCSARVVPKGTTLPGIQLIRIHTLPGKHLHATSLFLFAALHCLFFGRYAFVHLHNVEATFILPLLRLRYRIITTSHGPAQARDKWGKIAKFLIRLTEYPYIYLSNHITSVSKPLALRYQQLYHRHVHYIPNGVEREVTINVAGATKLLAQQGIEPGNYILFAAGRILATKGCHLLLEAFRNIQSDYKLVIIGDASHEPEYAQRLQQLADARVHFIPFIADKSILLGLVSTARLFVFPSTVEAMSMMLLEAASIGTPILCSNIPENTTVMPEQSLCFVSGDSKDLQQKLAWALASPQAMTLLGAQAKEWVNKEFRWADIVQKYEQLYAIL